MIIGCIPRKIWPKNTQIEHILWAKAKMVWDLNSHYFVWLSVVIQQSMTEDLSHRRWELVPKCVPHAIPKKKCQQLQFLTTAWLQRDYSLTSSHFGSTSSHMTKTVVTNGYHVTRESHGPSQALVKKHMDSL